MYGLVAECVTKNLPAQFYWQVLEEAVVRSHIRCQCPSRDYGPIGAVGRPWFRSGVTAGFIFGLLFVRSESLFEPLLDRSRHVAQSGVFGKKSALMKHNSD